MGQAREQAPAQLDTARGSSTTGAFVLGAPGTRVHAAPDRFVIGHQPGTYHRVLAGGCLVIGLGTAWFLWPYEPLLAAVFAGLFALPLLTLLNTQRYEVTRGMLRVRGKAFGRALQRDWPLPPDSAVRVTSYQYRDADDPTLWTAYQAQLRTQESWAPLAESTHRETVLPVARQIAEAAGVPLRD